MQGMAVTRESYWIRLGIVQISAKDIARRNAVADVTGTVLKTSSSTQNVTRL